MVERRGQFTRTGLHRWTNTALAAELGLQPYVPAATAAPKRAAAPGLLKLVAPSKRATPAALKPPSASPTRDMPRDIPAAMIAGLSNSQINALVAKGALPRPKNLADASAALWPVGAWREALRRDLVW